MDILRKEIIEAEKLRSEFLRWKLLLVAGLGAAGLGLTDSPLPQIVLALIPLVCVYVDLVARHMNLRILVIAAYLRAADFAPGDDGCHFREYEDLCKEKRHVFGFETVALSWSTIALSALTIYAGFAMEGLKKPAVTVLVCAGIVGLVAAIAVDAVFHRWRDEIGNWADQRLASKA